MSNISIAGTPLISQDGDDELQDFQYNGVDYLYNLEPQQLNFFKPVAFFDPYVRAEGKSSGTSDYNKTNILMPEGLDYRINKISGFKLPELTIKDDDFSTALRFNYVAKPEKPNKLTISWVEDAYQTVRRYHINWMNHWYNRYLDCMVCGRRGKYRNLSVVLFHYVNINKDTGAPIFRAKPIAMITFKGLIPEGVPAGNLDYSNGGNTATVDINYKINGAELFFYPYEQEDKEYIGDLAREVQTGLDIDSVKNTAIVGETEYGSSKSGKFGKVGDTNHEKVYYI